VDIKDASITAAKITSHTLGSQLLGTTVGIIVAGTQIKNAIVTPAKFSVLQEYGTVAAVTATGTYLTFDTAFSAPPAVVVTGIDAVARLAHAPVAGSAKIELGAAGKLVVHYVAWGAM
jgi:hypothetical protein